MFHKRISSSSAKYEGLINPALSIESEIFDSTQLRLSQGSERKKQALSRPDERSESTSIYKNKD